MGIVQSLTAARMLAIEAASVVDGVISGDNLILSRFDGQQIDAGNVRGPKGDKGDPGTNGNDGVSPYRNRILNNRFFINQKAFESGSVRAGTQGRVFGPDRWETGGAQTSPSDTIFSLQVAPPGTLFESDPYFLRLATTGGSQPQSDYVFLSQRIENASTLSGKVVTLSFWARVTTGPTKYVAPQFYQHFGTGGTPSSPVVIPLPKITVTTAWTRYVVTGTIPSTAGKIFGTNVNHYLSVRLWVSAGTDSNGSIDPIGFQYDNFDFYGFQLEEGSVATGLVMKAEGQDLLECQRFYWALGADRYAPFSGWVGAVTVNTQTVEAYIPYPVTMRKLPLVTMGGLYLQLPNGDYVTNAFTTVSDRSASAHTIVPRPGGTYRFSGANGPALPALGQAVRIVPTNDQSYIAFSAEF